MNRERIKRITLIALFSAVAFLLMMLEFPVPIIPSFIKFDFSEFPCLAAAFVAGPFDGVLVCLFKNLLHLPMTNTGGIGELANFLLGVSFVLPASLVYNKKRSFSFSVLGCVLGSVVSALISYPVNLYVTYPVYTKFLPLEQIISLYKEILPSVDTLGKALFVFNVPFTLAKGLIVSLINLLCYKKLEILYKK